MKKLIVGLSFMLFTCSLFSATLASKEEAMQLAREVMSQIEKGNMEAGVKLTQPYIVVPEHEFNGMLEK